MNHSVIRRLSTALVLLMLVSGCTTVQRQAALVGGVVGGAAGLTAGLILEGGKPGKTTAALAAGGAAAGAAIGWALGREVDKRKAKYASEEAFYDAQIQQTRDLNDKLTEGNVDLAKLIDQDDQTLQELRAGIDAGTKDVDRMRGLKSTLDERLASGKKSLKQAQDELGVQQDALADLKQKNNEGDQIMIALQTEVDRLQSQVNELNSHVDAIARQDDLLASYL